MSRSFQALVIALASGAFLPVVSPAQAAPSVPAFEQQRNQGIEYYKRKRYQAATQALREVVRSPSGKEDQRSWYYLAKTYYALTDIEEALPAAKEAVRLADSPKRLRPSKALLKRINEFFAGVEIRQADDQKGQVEFGYIHLEDTRGLINVKKKEAFAKIRARFREKKVRLPMTIYLPFGSYTANLAPFEIKPGETANAETYLYVPDGEADSASAWWYVGGGAFVAAGAAVAAVLLSAEEPTPQRRITQPTVDLGLR